MENAVKLIVEENKIIDTKPSHGKKWNLHISREFI